MRGWLLGLGLGAAGGIDTRPAKADNSRAAVTRAIQSDSDKGRQPI